MKFKLSRPAIPLSVAALIFSLLLSFCGSIAAIVFFLCVAVLCIALFFKGSKAAFVTVCVLLMPVLNFIVIEADCLKTVRDLSGSKVTVIGTVSDIDFRGEFVSITVNVDEGELRGIKCSLLTKDINGSIGDKIVAEAKISAIKEDYRSYNYSEGIFASGSITRLLSVEQGKGLLKQADKIRTVIVDALFTNMSYDSASALAGIVVGEDFYQSKMFTEAVRNSGVSHIMVVSGMHMTLICGSVYSILKRSQLSSRVSAVIVFAVTVILMIICGFTPSVLRAGISYIIMVIGMFFLKRSNGMVSLCLAVILMVIYNPYITGSVGFLLSVASTVGILVIYPELLARVHIHNKLLYIIADLFLMTASAMLATLPILFIFFGEVSGVALIVNMLISHIVNAVLVLAVIGVLLAPLPFGEYISKIPFGAADLMCSAFIKTINFFNNI